MALRHAIGAAEHQLRNSLRFVRKLHNHHISSGARNLGGTESEFGDVKTGLFGIDQLQTPDGFHVLRDSALKRADSLVEEIIHKPSGSQDVVALFDELSNCLCKVADLAEFIRVGHPQARFRATAEQASVAISSLVEQLNTDKRLYNSLRHSTFKDELDEFVAKLFMFDFEQSGIHMDDDKRKLVLQLNESILRLGSHFAANANQARLVDPSQLPDRVRHLFSSQNQQSNGKVLITGLHADSDDELVRETAYKTYLQPDKTQDDILTNLLRCRLRLAQLCGFESYAHRAVKGSIVGSPEVVNEFLDLLNDRVRDLAAKDYDQMLQLKLKDKPGERGVKLNAWDVPYYSANYKRSIYNESVLQCLPYFSVDVCMEGLDMIFNELYGVRMQVDRCKVGELWHKNVIKLSIIDQESNELLGYIYCDLFERQMKQQQDCHHTIQGGCYLRDGTHQLPIVVLVLSLPDDSNNGTGPSLLSPSMVDNLFHEMGHAMHSMLARTKYQHITGTRCSTDLAEVPSILMEFFASDPRVVSKFARHHASGQPMPTELINCWVKSKKVFTASETQLQVFYAALDQAYHSSRVCVGSGRDGGSTTSMLAKIQSQYYSMPYVEGTAWQLRFSHLVGYGAKYYSYLVSRAVATAIWTKLFAQDPLSRKAGLRYKNEVLAHGGGKPANQIAEDVLDCRVDADFIARSVISSFQQPMCE